jgi:hypothetical protein
MALVPRQHGLFWSSALSIAGVRPDVAGNRQRASRVALCTGYPGLALADWAAPDLFSSAQVSIARFRESEIYARFRDDPMCTAPPDLDAR